MPELYTKNGHNFYDMASMLQKGIRRADYKIAGYAANELFGRYYTFLWRRLLIISAEDCWGIITKEIVGLYEACKTVNRDRKGYEKDKIFVSKAILLLILARKNRDACYFANVYQISEVPMEIDQVPFPEGGIPEYVYDIHTAKGKAMGKTDNDMIVSEQKALTPHQQGLFDDASWDLYFKHVYGNKEFNKDDKFPEPTREDLKQLEHDEHVVQLCLDDFLKEM